METLHHITQLAKLVINGIRRLKLRWLALSLIVVLIMTLLLWLSSKPGEKLFTKDELKQTPGTQIKQCLALGGTARLGPLNEYQGCDIAADNNLKRKQP